MNKIVPLLLLPLGSTGQTRYPSPGIAFLTEIEDAGPEGISVLEDTSVYLTANQKWMGDGFLQSWVHKLDPTDGEVLQSRRLDQDGASVGACTILAPADGSAELLVINPGGGSSDPNTGIQAVRADTLQSVWSSNIVKDADRGVPPVIAPNGEIVYYSTSSGIAVLDKDGQVLWATSAIRTGQIAVTSVQVFAVDQTAQEQHPLNRYSLASGRLTGSSDRQPSASTTAGVVLSPDEKFAYTVRSGSNGGLYRDQANFLFTPSEVITTKVSGGKNGYLHLFRNLFVLDLSNLHAIVSFNFSASRFGPLLSPDGNVLYIINPLAVLVEAYSIPNDEILWRATVYPTIPPVLSEDGRALYTSTSSGSLVRIDTETGKIVWSYTDLPDGFLATAMVLSSDDSRLLLAGQVFDSHTGYAISFFTEDATFSPTVSPTISKSPTRAPVVITDTEGGAPDGSDRGINEPTAPSRGSTLFVSWCSGNGCLVFSKFCYLIIKSEGKIPMMIDPLVCRFTILRCKRMIFKVLN